MKIVIDTNVVISGVFFGGYPRKILESVYRLKTAACATPEIIDEYNAIVEEMIQRKQGNLRSDILNGLIARLEIITPITEISVCRDPDDDKFIGCAVDGKAVFIVSGDKDLLSLESYKDIEIITAADFCSRYLN